MPLFAPPQDLTRYKGYIFDCDGTLADTMPMHFLAWKQSLKEGGGTFTFTWELFLSRAGMSMEQTVSELSAQFRCALDYQLIADRQRTLFEELVEEVKPVPEVLSFARLVAETAPVSVASGSIRRSVDRTLRLIGALDLFPVIITPEHVQNGKPAPDMFLLAAEKMQVRPEECLVIEDGVLGIEAAKSAGMDCAIVETRPPEEPTRS